jgi:hypothetical protein
MAPYFTISYLGVNLFQHRLGVKVVGVTLAPSNDLSTFEMLMNNATPVQILGLYS